MVFKSPSILLYTLSGMTVYRMVYPETDMPPLFGKAQK